MDTPHLRPRWHFCAASTWLNDPNGLVHVDGTYHLFFQTNPQGTDWGNMSWGHATSRDLLRWQEHPLALRHTEEEAVFSGSVVVDHGRTSGLGDESDAPLVALYTSAWTAASPRAGTQSQSLAHSEDGGLTWTRHPGNPVLDRASADFRDPKVFRHEASGAWVMVAVEAVHRQVVVYRSRDLLGWELASTFGPAGRTEGVWECPDLFELPVAGTDRTAWVLVVSVLGGGPAGGSGTQYLVGDFDGTRFVPDGAGARWLDHGPDHYAAVSFDNTPGRRLMVGWASNWAYAAAVPTSPWRGCMSLVREVALVPDEHGAPVLRQRPVLDDDVPEGVLVERLTVPPRGARTLRVTTADGGDPLEVRVDLGTGVLELDRSACGDTTFAPGFPTSVRAPLPRSGRPVEVLVVVDGCVVEVYADDGRVTLTGLVLPTERLVSAQVLG